MSDVLGSSGIEVDTQEAAGEGGLEGCTATGDRPESDETPGASAGAPTTAAGNLSPKWYLEGCDPQFPTEKRLRDGIPINSSGNNP
ncbi:hypothetical protein J6590_106724 [Homalodisca vitripennis]|nr:hypothetical protein J6590_106724 [Homalodisca vitripennis]